MRKYYFLAWVILSKRKLKVLRKQLELNSVSQDFIDLYEIKEKYIESLKLDLKTQKARAVCLMDEDYPKELRVLEEPPLVLSLYGDLSSLYENSSEESQEAEESEKLSIVGSRDINQNLKVWFEEEFKVLKKYIIVSGGAIGVDQEAHKNAIKHGNKTIIVLPSGILNPYPSNLFSWFKHNLENKGVLFISQFSPHEGVKKMNFYPRNELLAAFSKKILILQANEKSGTMVTAKYAADLGKDVYALSCSPWSKDFSGNKKLIEEGAYQTIDLNLFHF